MSKLSTRSQTKFPEISAVSKTVFEVPKDHTIVTAICALDFQNLPEVWDIINSKTECRNNHSSMRRYLRWVTPGRNYNGPTQEMKFERKPSVHIQWRVRRQRYGVNRGHSIIHWCLRLFKVVPRRVWFHVLRSGKVCPKLSTTSLSKQLIIGVPPHGIYAFRWSFLHVSSDFLHHAILPLHPDHIL